MEYERLPQQYWKKHDFLLYVYDVLGDMLRQADHKKLSNIILEFDDTKQTEQFTEAEDMFVWMDENGYHDKSLKLFNNHVFFLLLKDFCYYIYESFSCAERGKVTVAYTLLRKPLRDNLLYMEWLLADNEEFYQTFLYKSTEEYDVSNWHTFPMDRLKKIIKSASQKSYMGNGINSNNLVYTFRFDSEDEIGLQRIWNKSMHLVTTSKNYRTEKTNLNFIFADEEIWNDYWNYYYLVLPQLMAYVLEICEALFLTTVEVDTFNLGLNRSIRFAKYAELYPEVYPENESLRQMPKELFSVIKETHVKPYFQCENCGHNIVLTLDVLNMMMSNVYVICPSCHQEHSICKYYTDYKYMAVHQNNKTEKKDE
jgi:hypothetical protein